MGTNLRNRANNSGPAPVLDQFNSAGFIQGYYFFINYLIQGDQNIPLSR